MELPINLSIRSQILQGNVGCKNDHQIHNTQQTQFSSFDHGFFQLRIGIEKHDGLCDHEYRGYNRKTGECIGWDNTCDLFIIHG